MPLPDRMFRFLRSNKHYTESSGKVDTKAFEPPKKTPPREDGFFELSVDWDDDTGVLPKIKERKEATAVVALHRENLDSLSSGPAGIPNGVLTYERAALDDNPHHGNLLVLAEAPLQDRMRTYRLLATLAVRV